MRVHIDLEDELVDEIDRRVGHERRNAYIADAVRQAARSRAMGEDPVGLRIELGGKVIPGIRTSPSGSTTPGTRILGASADGGAPTHRQRLAPSA